MWSFSNLYRANTFALATKTLKLPLKIDYIYFFDGQNSIFVTETRQFPLYCYQNKENKVLWKFIFCVAITWKRGWRKDHICFKKLLVFFAFQFIGIKSEFCYKLSAYIATRNEQWVICECSKQQMESCTYFINAFLSIRKERINKHKSFTSCDEVITGLT